MLSSLGSILVVLALLILVALFVSRPFFEPRAAGAEATMTPIEHERSALLAERDRLLNALQELDFDYTLGKIPEEDYPDQRTHLLQRGANVLRQLDAIEPGQTEKEAAEERLEAALAARRLAGSRIEAAQAVPGNGSSASARAAVITADDDVEIMLAKRRSTRQGKAAGFCPQCGGPLQKSDIFCPKCGARQSV